jgi:tetratricopeptide (TPR) repeat protein
VIEDPIDFSSPEVSFEDDEPFSLEFAHQLEAEHKQKELEKSWFDQWGINAELAMAIKESEPIKPTIEYKEDEDHQQSSLDLSNELDEDALIDQILVNPDENLSLSLETESMDESTHSVNVDERIENEEILEEIDLNDLYDAVDQWQSHEESIEPSLDSAFEPLIDSSFEPLPLDENEEDELLIKAFTPIDFDEPIDQNENAPLTDRDIQAQIHSQIELSMIFRQMGQIDQAIFTLKQLLNQNRYDRKIYEQLSEAYLSLGQKQQALDILELGIDAPLIDEDRALLLEQHQQIQSQSQSKDDE